MSRANQSRPAEEAGPAISPWLLRWFIAYSRRYLRRHFHSLRVARDGFPPPDTARALVLYGNHSSWWDPLVGLVLKAEFFGGRNAFAPMDAAALQKYKLFRKLGFFGVERSTRRGAAQFLRTAKNLLRAPDTLLLITPQGRFADVRERPVQFEAGLGHLAARAEGAVFLPMATELIFWEERLPEILVRFGEPVTIGAADAASRDAAGWTALFEQKLAATQDALTLQVQRRDPAEFKTLLRGGAGQGGFYDWWRSIQARLRGQSFQKEHGAQ